MFNKIRKNPEELGRIKRKKICAGHYVYGGYHIIRKRWLPDNLIFINTTPDFEGYWVWHVEELKRSSKEVWRADKKSTLGGAIQLVDNQRARMWTMVNIIENE